MPQSSRWPVAQELHEMLLLQTYMYLYLTLTHSTAKNTYIPGRRLLRSIAPPSIVNDNVQSGSSYYHKHVNNPAYICTRQNGSRFHITVARSHIDSVFGLQPASVDERPKDKDGSEVARYCSRNGVSCKPYPQTDCKPELIVCQGLRTRDPIYRRVHSHPQGSCFARVS